MLFSLGMQAQAPTIIIDNKTNCDILIQVNYCISGDLYINAPHNYQTSEPLTDNPKTFKGSFNNGTNNPINGSFGWCIPAFTNAGVDPCYTQHVNAYIISPNLYGIIIY